MKKIILPLFILLSFLAQSQDIPASKPIVRSIVWILEANPPSNPTIGQEYIDTGYNKYIYNGSTWILQGGSIGAVDSVNGQIGAVNLDPDDLDDSGTANKFASAAELAQIAANTNKRTYPIADENKVNNITVNQPVDLDALAASVANALTSEADPVFSASPAASTTGVNTGDETATSVKDKLESLTGASRLDASAIQNLPNNEVNDPQQSADNVLQIYPNLDTDGTDDFSGAWSDIIDIPANLDVDGSGTKIEAGLNGSVTGTGTTADPYVISAGAPPNPTDELQNIAEVLAEGNDAGGASINNIGKLFAEDLYGTNMRSETGKRPIYEGDILQPLNAIYSTNGVDAVPKKTYVSQITNRFYGRGTEIKVYKDSVEVEVETQKGTMFDGSFDTSYTIATPGASQFKLTLDLNDYNLVTSRYTYVNGVIIINFYAGASATVDAVRWYNYDTQQWQNATVTPGHSYASIVNQYIIPVTGNFMSDIEFTLTPISPTSDVRISQIEYHASRMSPSEIPLITAAGGSVYGDLFGKYRGEETWKIDQNSGTISSNSVRINSKSDGNDFYSLYSQNGSRQMALYGYLDSYLRLQADNVNVLDFRTSKENSQINFSTEGVTAMVVNSNQDLNILNHGIKNLLNPILPQDAATKGYVDQEIASVSGGGLQESDIDTFAELNTIVADRSLLAAGSNTVNDGSFIVDLTGNSAKLGLDETEKLIELRTGDTSASPAANGSALFMKPDTPTFRLYSTGGNQDFTLNRNGAVNATDFVRKQDLDAAISGVGSSGTNYQGNLYFEPMTGSENGSQANTILDNGEIKRRVGLVNGGQYEVVTLDNTHAIGEVYNYTVATAADSLLIRPSSNSTTLQLIGQDQSSGQNQITANRPQTLSFVKVANQLYHVMAFGTTSTADFTPPTIVSAITTSGSPNNVIVEFSEPVNHIAVSSPSLSGDYTENYTIANNSGSDTMVFVFPTPKQAGDSYNIDFTGASIQDFEGNYLASVSFPVDNQIPGAVTNLYAENDAASPTAESNSVGSNWFFGGSELSDGLTSTQGAGVTNGSYALTVTENNGSSFSRARHTGNYGAGTYNLTMDANLVGGNTSARIVVIDGTAGNSTELATATLSNSVNNINLNFTATVSDWSIMVYPSYFTAGNGSIEFDNVVITQ